MTDWDGFAGGGEFYDLLQDVLCCVTGPTSSPVDQREASRFRHSNMRAAQVDTNMYSKENKIVYNVSVELSGCS